MSKIRHYKTGDEPVPGYRLTAFLGSGGFGEVWKATAPGGTEVAIKINSLGMKGALKEFRSLKLVKRIQYPNLVPILAIWLKNEQGDILQEAAFDEIGGESVRGLSGTITSNTIEYVPRPEPAELVIAMGLGHKSLADRLQECNKQGLHGIPVDELLNYMQDAARAIDYLNSPRHEFGSGPKAIQHCDIKPPNILIVGDAAQVCDFGLAREVADPRSTSLALSPVYAAPEMIESNTPGPSTDQYSLAMSYLELRTGALPFPENATAHTVIQAHLTGNIDLARLPPAEREVIRRATARQPIDRFASACDMVAALREACHPTPVVPRRRNRLWWSAAVALVLVSTALAIQLATSGPRALRLPAGFIAAPGATLVDVHGRSCPNEVICRLHGLELPLRLVDGRREGAFYIAQDKVSNDLFARFAKENPAAVAASRWQQGACANKSDLGVENRGNFPVFRVSCVEAAKFARWLSGALPSVDEWDEAAGRYADANDATGPDERGPFRQPLDPNTPVNEQIAVDRGALGPLPVGTAAADVSTPYGCRDMAGNGSEWTSTPRDAAERFSPDAPDERLSIILRGRSYMHPDPLRFRDLDDRSQDEALRCTDADCNTSFRVVFKFADMYMP
jgi:serine/threonine protein kinase